MAKTYWEKLQDPRWQKKRLEVMEFADFCCENCGDKENTLNVHHKEYLKGHEPWEYDLSQLVCLCEDCHKDYHISFDALKYVTSRLPVNYMFDRQEVAFIIGAAIGLEYKQLLDLTDNEDNEYWYARFAVGKELPNFIGYIYQKIKEGEYK